MPSHVQVVAEALRAKAAFDFGTLAPPAEAYLPTAEAIVAALKAAGALMPEEFTSVDRQAGFVIADAICGHGQPEINLPAPCNDCRDVAEVAASALSDRGLLLGFADRVEVVRLATQEIKRSAVLQEVRRVLSRVDLPSAEEANALLRRIDHALGAA